MQGYANNIKQLRVDLFSARERLYTLDIQRIADIDRRVRCLHRLDDFVRTYFSHIATDWTNERVRYIEFLERAIVDGGYNAVNCFRGMGKTTLLKLAVLWGILRGEAHYVLCVQATSSQSKLWVSSFKTLMVSSDLFQQDFPDVCTPIKQKLKTRRSLQIIDGKTIDIELNSFLQFPDVPNALYSRAVLQPYGKRSSLRGIQTDTLKRPDLILLDDIQSGSETPAQCDQMMRFINSDLLPCQQSSGKRRVISVGTIRESYDVYSNIKLDNRYKKLCFPAIKNYPKNMNLWDALYERWNEDQESAFEWYEAKKSDFNEGYQYAEVDFGGGYPDSGVFWMFEYLRDPATFVREQQSDPESYSSRDVEVLTRKDIENCMVDTPRMTGDVFTGIDVHKDILYSASVCAYDDLFSLCGCGAYPPQKLDSRRKMKGFDGNLSDALKDYVNGELRSSKSIFIDSGYSAGTIYDFCDANKKCKPSKGYVTGLTVNNSGNLVKINTTEIKTDLIRLIKAKRITLPRSKVLMRHLLSENAQRKMVSGKWEIRYVQIDEDNHLLDCIIYALAAYIDKNARGLFDLTKTRRGAMKIKM